MNVLVTGGAGYIGSRLVRALAAEHSVTALDNLRRGTVRAGGVRFVEGDIRNPAILADVTRGVEVVFHLAAESAVMSAAADPEYCFETNVAGTFRVLQAAKRNGVKRIVFTSSREAYGEAQTLPVSEAAPLVPRNAYGASKAAAELCCGAFLGEGMEVSIVRLSNVYGPGDKGRVIPLFVANALRGAALTLFGSGQVMDFVWVDAVIQALITLGFGPYIPGPLNLGSGKGVTITQLAERVIREASSPSILQIAPKRNTEVVRFIADTKAAQTALGWTTPDDPLFGLAEVIGIARA